VGKTADELRRDLELQRNELSHDLEAVGDRISPRRAVQRRKASVRQTAHRITESVMGSADDATSSMGDRASAMKSGVADVASSAGDKVSEMPQRIERTTQGNPMAAGLIAFGAGLLAASLIKPSRREQDIARKLQPNLEGVAAQAGAAVQDTVSELKPQAQHAVDDIKNTATDAAKQTGQDAKSAVQTNADAVRRS